MKSLSLVLFLLLSVSFVSSIQVSGNQTGTWTPDNNPYQVVGAISVPSGGNLTIQPGVLVQIMGSYQITVAGTLTAQGTETDSIRFVNAQANPTALWPGLRFENTTQTSNLSHVYIEYGTYGIRSMNSPLVIGHCRFNLCEKGMDLYAIGSANPANVLVEYCLIENSIQNGILISQNSNAVIQFNEIRNNGTGTQFRGAIQLSNQSAGGSNNPMIADNHIHHNLKQGITAWDVASANAINPQILNNVIEYNYTGIYLLQASGYVADNQINHNFIPGDMNSGAGVMVSGITSVPYFERNTITGNYTGFYITNNAMPVLGNLSIYHSWAQGENIIVDNIDANGILHSVFCDAYPNATNIIMAENNNWGVFTADEIAEGINDHNDVATLPTVDFEPFLNPILPTSILGNYVYNGAAQIANARLELISDTTGEVLFTFPLPEQAIGVAAPIEENFHVQVVLTRVSDGGQLYGCAGGYLNPGIFSPGDFTPVMVGTIEVFDQPPPRYDLMGESIEEGDLIMYPLMHGLGLYAWRQLDWLTVTGDYLYLHRHLRRTPAGLITINLPANTIWRKYLNIQPGDTWQQTEVVDDAGTLLVSNAAVENCATFLDIIAYQMIVRKDDTGSVLDKSLFLPDGDVIYRYAQAYTVARESILRFGSPDPLAAGAIWLYAPLALEYAPNYLSFDPSWVDTRYQLRLFWQAPAHLNNNWTHYRIYRNMMVLAEIPLTNSDYTDASFDPAITGTTCFYVTAWDGNVESEPSNAITVIIVGNEDELVQPVKISAYPNPVAISQGQHLMIALGNADKKTAQIEIFNLKGQRVHQTMLAGDTPYFWQGTDNRGNRCATGIYFVKVQVPGSQSFIKKLLIH